MERGLIRMPDRASLVIGGAFVAVAGYLVGLGWAMGHTTYDVWGTLVILPGVIVLGAIGFRTIDRIEADRRMTQLFLVAFGAKVLGTVARYIISFDVYDKADAQAYHRAGAELSRQFRSGNFSLGDEPMNGSRVIEIVTGVLYTIIGPTRVGAFIIFSLLSFVGMYLFYRAFRRACPNGDNRRYALLLFFLPSMLYWPSSLGKEAWMTFVMGLVAFGAARVLTRTRNGLFPLALGLAGAGAVRPHVALLLVGGLIAAYLVRKGSGASPLAPAAKLAGVVFLLLGGFLALSRTEGVLGLEGLNQNAVENLLDRTQAQTTGGGSQFAAVRVRSPLDLPLATVTVLIRPFPHEADNLQALGAAAEGAIILGLFIVGFGRVRSFFSSARHSPYLVFAVVYTLGFIVAFSAIANFGILTRQRVQVLPLVIMLLALPRPVRRGREVGFAAAHAPRGAVAAVKTGAN